MGTLNLSGRRCRGYPRASFGVFNGARKILVLGHVWRFDELFAAVLRA